VCHEGEIVKEKKSLAEELYAAKGDMDKINSVLEKLSLVPDNRFCVFTFADMNRLHLRINTIREIIPIEIDCLNDLMICCINFVVSQNCHEKSRRSILFLYKTIGEFFPDFKTNFQAATNLIEPKIGTKKKIGMDLLLALALDFGHKMDFVTNIDTDFDHKNLKVIGPPNKRRYWPMGLSARTFEMVLLASGDLPKTPEEALRLSQKTLELAGRE
jgi:hypothetical protein